MTLSLQGYFYTSVLVAIAVLSLAALAAGLWPAPRQLESQLVQLDTYLQDEQWLEASVLWEDIHGTWKHARGRLGINTGHDDLDAFDTSLSRLGTQIEARQVAMARAELSMLLALMDKL